MFFVTRVAIKVLSQRVRILAATSDTPTVKLKFYKLRK